MFPYSDVDTVSRILIFKLFIRASCFDNERNLEPLLIWFLQNKSKMHAYLLRSRVGQRSLYILRLMLSMKREKKVEFFILLICKKFLIAFYNQEWVWVRLNKQIILSPDKIKTYQRNWWKAVFLFRDKIGSNFHQFLFIFFFFIALNCVAE